VTTAQSALFVESMRQEKKRTEATSAQSVETRLSHERRKSFSASEIETLREAIYQMGMRLTDKKHKWSYNEINLYREAMRILK